MCISPMPSVTQIRQEVQMEVHLHHKVQHACTPMTLLTASYWRFEQIYSPDLHQTAQETSKVEVFIIETECFYCAVRVRSSYIF